VAAADYLAVAPQVVAVVRDLPLDRTRTALPDAPVDLERLAALGERYNLASPVQRLTKALVSRR
jgi:hypothetical protein